MTTGMTTPTVCLPRPLPHQIPVLLSDARFKVLTCGRRWGKTATGLQAALRGHGPRRGVFRGAIDGGRVWWVAPNYPTIESSNIWRDLKRATKDAWIDKSEIDRTVYLPGGGSISVRSADNPDSLRGPGLDGVILDEAAFLKPDVWRTVIRQALADKQGWALFATTPNGQNWFYDLFRAASARPGWEAWQRPTSDNPLITPAELADMLEEVGPRRFAQENEAQFVAMEGACFPVEYFADALWCDRWPDKFEAGVMAIDPAIAATAMSDYSAVVYLGRTGGRYYVDCRMLKTHPLGLVEAVAAMCDQYQPVRIGVEANAFQAVLQPLFDLWCRQHKRDPLPIALVHNHEKKEVRIQRLDPYLSQKKFSIIRNQHCKILVQQLMMFPQGEHDDGPDALEMALRLMRHVTKGKR